MKKYTEGGFFKKYWEWFADPREVEGVAIANFFSYSAVDVDGFKRKEGLTSVIDLTQPLEAIWERMRKKFVREQIEKGKRKGLTAVLSDDFASFESMYGRFTQQSDFDAVSKHALRNGLLFLAYHESQAVAGGVFIADELHMRALALASRRFDETTGRMRDLIGEANRLVIWEAIQYGKANGKTVLDLGGIAPESDNAHWRAVATFKEAFGGERRSAYYYHKIYSPLLRAWMWLRRALSR